MQKIFLNLKLLSTVLLLYNVYISEKNKRIIEKKSRRKFFSANTLILIIYNISLFLYSIIAFKRVSSFLINFLRTYTFDDLLRNNHNIVYNFVNREFYYFHLSKYFELLETIINFTNGKKCTFLQSYHHSGVLVGTYLICRSKTHISYVFLLLNSFIHSIMYLYFLLTAFKIYFPYKLIITILQIVQFVAGGIILFIHLLYSDLYSKELDLLKIQIFTTVFIIAYLVGLIILFIKFFMKNNK